MGRRLNKRERALLARVAAVRAFPINTCPASRHTQMVAEALMRGNVWPSIGEEPEHIGGSMMATVAALYEARTEIAKLKAAPPSPGDGRETGGGDG